MCFYIEKTKMGCGGGGGGGVYNLSTVVNLELNIHQYTLIYIHKDYAIVSFIEGNSCDVW